MKIGDKLYCKKSITDKNNVYYKVNNYYIITSKKDDNVYYITSEKDDLKFDLSIPIKTIDMDDNLPFEDFFYTETEYRKLKLKKINESNLSKF